MNATARLRLLGAVLTVGILLALLAVAAAGSPVRAGSNTLPTGEVTLFPRFDVGAGHKVTAYISPIRDGRWNGQFDLRLQVVGR